MVELPPAPPERRRRREVSWELIGGLAAILILALLCVLGIICPKPTCPEGMYACGHCPEGCCLPDGSCPCPVGKICPPAINCPSSCCDENNQCIIGMRSNKTPSGFWLGPVNKTLCPADVFCASGVCNTDGCCCFECTVNCSSGCCTQDGQTCIQACPPEKAEQCGGCCDQFGNCIVGGSVCLLHGIPCINNESCCSGKCAADNKCACIQGGGACNVSSQCCGWNCTTNLGVCCEACPEGVACPSGCCTPEGKCFCDGQNPCPEGMLCENGRCVGCGPGINCPEGQACVDGYCRQTCPEAGCPSGQKCIDGKCVPACSTPEDCPEGICLGGACVCSATGDFCTAPKDCCPSITGATCKTTPEGASKCCHSCPVTVSCPSGCCDASGNCVDAVIPPAKPPEQPTCPTGKRYNPATRQCEGCAQQGASCDGLSCCSGTCTDGRCVCKENLEECTSDAECCRSNEGVGICVKEPGKTVGKCCVGGWWVCYRTS